MASTTQHLSVSEYLKTEYEPDAEFVDGVVEERAVPEYSHADWQFAIARWFQDHAVAWHIRVKPELRVQIGPTRFRVPDVTIMDRDYLIEQIVTHPPLAVFEILSPEDAVQRITRKLNDYQTMGILEIWVIDPETRLFSRFEEGQLSRRDEFLLERKGIKFPLKAIEALLD